jgi:membrane fusion protein, multidrug efflux system
MTRKDKIEHRVKELSEKLKVAAFSAKQRSGYDKWPHEKKKKAMFSVLLVLFILPFIVRGCSQNGKNNNFHPRPVETTVAVKKDVPVYMDSFGQMLSVGDVDIKSQVTGKILEVKFAQGDEVKKGDVLFLIDPAPYKAELDKAEALLVENTAMMRLKSDTLERNIQLFEKGLISMQEIEQYQTDLDAATATVELNKASVRAARIDLDYCEITSPVNGLAGKRQVDPGNIVSANSGPTLVNVKELDALYVDFTLAEKYLSRVRSAMAGEKLKVEVSIPEEEGDIKPGVLDLVDNFVDPRTGTFALRASVDNSDRKLWPGQFVNVRLIVGTEKGAVLVPYAATKIGKQGYYVFVVTGGNKADLRQVVVGSRQDSDIVIEKGIQEGDIVVTSGQLALRPGTEVVDMSKQKTNGKKGKKK